MGKRRCLAGGVATRRARPIRFVVDPRSLASFHDTLTFHSCAATNRIGRIHAGCSVSTQSQALMRSPRICRRALLIGHLKANPKSKDAGRKCAEESAAFERKARSAAKPAARTSTNRGDRASACDEVACVKTVLGFNKKKPHPGLLMSNIHN